MFTAHRLSKSFGLHPLLKDVTFHINPGDRVGLIGPNGCGKSTLLKICAGLERPDSGYVATVPGDLKVGYLAQGYEPGQEATLADVLAGVGADVETLLATVTRLAEALSAQPEQPELQLAYDHALERLDRLNAGRIATLLEAFGLGDMDRMTPMSHLSGGQKTRLALATLLLQEPALLLLDEPTNHLDIAMLEWLEAWLSEYAGAALIVSHDRTFLDRTVNKILDLNPTTGDLREYAGNYSDYIVQFAAEQARQLDAWRDQRAETRRVQADIQRTLGQARQVELTTTPRNPGPRRIAKKVAKKAKAREKKLERYLASEERVEKPSRHWQVKLDFDAGHHISRDILVLDELAVGYRAPLLSGLTATVRAGQRIVLTGENGAGKTTLLRTIAGELPALAGTIRLGRGARLGYMTQEQEGLKPKQTPLETLQSVAPMNDTDARSFLHYFLFTGDESLRENRLLSFGERARLMLALLIAQGCNLLLLDEPINHLDIPSRERFEQALATFDGTVIAVVHDRYFIHRFATHVWWVEAGSVRTAISGLRSHDVGMISHVTVT